MNNNEEKPFKRKCYLVIAHLVGGIIFALIMCGIFGYFVMHLWNYLMPEIFGLKTITFLQGTAFVLLGRLVFGSFHGRGFLGMHHKNHNRSDTEEKRCC